MSEYKRIIITGCPRSGTGYISQVFGRCGLRAGHEHAFGLKGCDANALMQLDVESSWLAAPYLRSDLDKYVRIHIYRRPLDVIRSLTRIDFWRHPGSAPYRSYVRQHFSYFSPDPIEMSMMFWLYWDMLAYAHADFHIRVDQIDSRWIAMILKTAGHSEGEGKGAVYTKPVLSGPDAVPTNFNTKTRGFDADFITQDYIKSHYLNCYELLLQRMCGRTGLLI